MIVILVVDECVACSIQRHRECKYQNINEWGIVFHDKIRGSVREVEFIRKNIIRVIFFLGSDGNQLLIR